VGKKYGLSIRPSGKKKGIRGLEKCRKESNMKKGAHSGLKKKGLIEVYYTPLK